MAQDIYDPAFVASLFDRCSTRYRRWSAVSSFGFVWLWRKQCVDRLVGQSNVARIHEGTLSPRIPKVTQVIDLMAGTGEVWPHVLGAFPRAQITAIDISPAMHAEAITKLHGTRAHKINHLTANALDDDLPANTADLLVATFGLKTFNKEQQTVLAGQIARILMPGGSFSLIEASDPIGWPLRPFYRAYLHGALPLIERLFLKAAQDFSMISTYTRTLKTAVIWKAHYATQASK
jgi:ubiquinone/menaquinone biosynthesis C-methylase UbiE